MASKAIIPFLDFRPRLWDPSWIEIGRALPIVPPITKRLQRALFTASNIDEEANRNEPYTLTPTP
jgi:hypothetical protein